MYIEAKLSPAELKLGLSLAIFVKKLPHPQEFFWANYEKIKIVPNWLKWRENWSKIIFLIFNQPPHKKKLWVKNEKKKKVTPNWLKWRENWSKINFIFLTPPLKKCGQKWKKSKLFQIDWNVEKIGQKSISNFDLPPQPEKNLAKNEKILIVPNWPKWRENLSNFNTLEILILWS